MGQVRNWEAVGAIAGIAGAFLALVAWVAPNDSSPQAGPAPYTSENTAPVRIRPTAYSPPPFTSEVTTYSPPTSAPPSTPTSTQPPPVSVPSSVPSVRPLGCDESFDAINTFDKAWAAAATPGARFTAADNGYKATSGISLNADDPPRSQDRVLSGDFVNIMVPLMSDEPVQPGQLKQLNADIGALRAACGAT